MPTSPLVLVTCVLSVSVQILAAAPGDLDPSFGTDGVVEVTSMPRAVVLQPDGKLVTLPHASIERRMPDGQLDVTFGGDGNVVPPSGELLDFNLSTLTLQPDGRILAAGAGKEERSIPNDIIVVARITPTGQMDTSFSGDGLVVTALQRPRFGSLRVDRVFAMPDGKILIVGHFSDFVLIQYLPTGELDTTFGNGGIKIFDNLFPAMDAILQPDGKIIACGGSVFNRFSVYRFLPDGTLDTTFSGDGQTVVNFGLDPGANSGGLPTSLALQPDGKILVAGRYGSPKPGWENNPYLDIGVARLLPNGQLDPTFSTDGKQIFPTESASGSLAQGAGQPSVVIRPDGKILLAGGFPGRPGVAGYWSMARLTVSGTFDSSFSDDGQLFAPAESPYCSRTMGLLPQPDGKIIAWGSSRTGPLKIARFLIDPDTDGDGADDATEAAIGTSLIATDSDEDGISDGDELLLHSTDPLDEDSDDDGLLDGAEVQTHGSDPNLVDTDSDGLRDQAEVTTHGTSPVLSDSDDDGLSDYDELTTYSTDPLIADMDGDGLLDGFEILTTMSDPTKKDTDGDGYTDRYEYETGLSPTDANSKPVALMRIHHAVELEVVTEIGKTYRVQASDNLQTWVDTDIIIQGTGESVRDVFRRTTDFTAKHWRVREE